MAKETPVKPEAAVTPAAKTTDKPLGTERKPSKFSIQQMLNQQEQEQESEVAVSEEHLPNHHFSDSDLQNEWTLFLGKIRSEDIVLYNAISGFRLVKVDEDTIRIHYPSASAKAEFEAVQGDFFNHFKRKVSHYRLTVDYQMDLTLKQEILTKRKLFNKMAEKNPLLYELDELFKFDLS